MSTKRGDTPNVNEGFIRPDMPFTPGRCLLHLLCWLVYIMGCTLAGCFIYLWISQTTGSEPAPLNYRLSDEHYIYKKKPLPLPQESVTEETAWEGDSGEQPAPENFTEQSELKARVKQAMADIEQQ